MNREQRTEYARRLVSKYRELGWTQDQLAEAARISSRAVSDFVRHERVPNEATLDGIAAALGYAADPAEARASWPIDVSVFLDLLGVWLMARPEPERRSIMRDMARQVAESR
jgi:transcriptional regulator with XRE-family HTH domain